MKVKVYVFWGFWLASLVALTVLTVGCLTGAIPDGQDGATLALLVADWVLLPLCFWYSWHKMALEWVYILVREEFYERAGKVYLWGIPLAEIIQQELPRRLGKYQGSGFCHEFAAATMFALKGVKTARLCHGISPEHGLHSWVEFRRYGVWWVADPAWAYQECVPWPRWICRKNLDLEIETVCEHEEFWQGPFAGAEWVLTDPEHELQDSILVDFLPVFWPAFGYGMRAPDEGGRLQPIEVEYEPVKPTKPASDEVLANLKNREFIMRFMDDSSFYALEDADDTTT